MIMSRMYLSPIPHVTQWVIVQETFALSYFVRLEVMFAPTSKVPV